MSIARHPLTIFLVVGVLLFVLDRWRSTESIVIDEAVTERVAGLWETQMGTPPDSETLEALLAAWLREEIFYREALRRGLDADDTVVRRRLVQKLEFLVQDMTPGAVSDGDLEAYFEEHRERYRLPERWTFEQQQYATKAEAEAALEALRRGEGLPRGREDLPRHFVGKSQAELQQALGSALASALREVPQNQWAGPLESPFGSHLLRLGARLPAELPPLSFVAPRVRTDYLRDAREASLNRFFQSVRGRYGVDDRR